MLLRMALFFLNYPVRISQKSCRATTAAKDRKFKAIVVYRLDHISRNISDFSSLIEELGRLGIKTKTGRSFTRFSIKFILQNPVYLIADKDAYQHFVDNEAALFSSESGKKASPPS